MVFHDRAKAGHLLARAIRARGFLADRRESLVLAIPRGGVVVGAEVARNLLAPLDVWLARKIGAPGNPEFAIGSVTIDGEAIFDQSTIDVLGIPRGYLEEAIERESEELARRMILFRGHSEPVNVQGKTVILVDDGIATGATALAALASLKRSGAARRILAVPVAPYEVIPHIQAAADEIVVLEAPRNFSAVGQFYEEFEQVPDEEVIRLLHVAAHPSHS